MLLTAKIKTLVSTGSPNYDICNQATSALSFTNMLFKMTISKNGGTTQTLVNTTDLSTVAGLTFATYTYDNYDITFTSFTIDAASSTLQANIEVFYTGTTNKVTWEKFNVILEISKTGYISYLNIFEFYNYDIGNTTGTTGLTSSVGNNDFEIILTDIANNLDIYNRQTKTGSALLTIRRPFSDEVHIYNMSSTEGTITYSTINGVIGSGQNCFIVEPNDILVQQDVVLFNGQSCSSTSMCLNKVWFYTLNTSYSKDNNSCNNCVNNILNTTASYSIDASLVSVFNINGVPYFLSEFMTNSIFINVLNYKSEIIEDDEYVETVTYALWTSNSSQFLTPVDLVFIPSEIGSNVLSFVNSYYYGTQELYKCLTNYELETCNWWTIEPKEDCNKYLFTNCRNSITNVVIQLMDDNKVFQDLSAPVPVAAFSTLDLSFDVDGIYLIKVIPISGSTQYYSLPIYCSLQNCILDYLNKILCNKPTLDNCKKDEDHYNFNALMLNAHTFFLLLNQELNYNYIYTTIPQAKITELYTIKTFIDRFAEYCEKSDSLCIPCNQ
jgi:hypothetical protein